MTSAPPGHSTTVSRLPLAHLFRLTDVRGIFEHAEDDEPRTEHGYCVDDVARALSFVVHEAAMTEEGTPHLTALIGTYLTFIERAIQPNGATHNRMNADGEWTDVAAGGDWWGRAIGALGTTAALATEPDVVERATRSFQRAARWDTPDMHARLFAAVGAADALAADVPRLAGAARRLIRRADALVEPGLAAGPGEIAGSGAGVRRPTESTWPWPEPRLRYANGIIPEALIAGGSAIGNTHMFDRGLRLLDFLLETVTVDGHLSLPGTEGWGPRDARPQFDQQPIEAAKLAQACARAWNLTGDTRWRDGVTLAWRWFLGDNDSGTRMVDLETGAGYDGLMPSGRNSNRGAESTLAALSTHQLVRQLGLTTETS